MEAGPSPALLAHVAAELRAPVFPEAQAFAHALAARPGVVAVLFYGSCLQRQSSEGMLDFYVLTDGSAGAYDEGALIAAAGRLLPPNVYPEQHERLKAKAAVLSLSAFRERMAPGRIDTTFWARFCQPAALLWARDEPTGREVDAAIAEAVSTAAGWAGKLANGAEGAEAWRRLFAHTYRVEIRVEGPGRAAKIVDTDPRRYDALWALTAESRSQGVARRSWALRRILGKPLHIARLLKAALTFEGGPRYLLWKIKRHRRARN